MITDQDIEKLRQVFATKDDLQRFATKDDFASIKNDIAGIKSELKNFATKKDLEEMGKNISSEIKIVIDMIGEQDVKLQEHELEIRTTRIFKGEAEARLQGIERQILRISK